MKPSLSKGTCCFCQTQKVGIFLFKTGNSICLKCLHLTSQMTGQRDINAVVCDKCQSDDGFTLAYGANTTLTFNKSSIDENREAVYKLVKTKGDYKVGQNPVEAKCLACKQRLRFWIVTQNKYVETFFTQEFIEKL